MLSLVRLPRHVLEDPPPHVVVELWLDARRPDPVCPADLQHTPVRMHETVPEPHRMIRNAIPPRCGSARAEVALLEYHVQVFQHAERTPYYIRALLEPGCLHDLVQLRAALRHRRQHCP